MVRRARRRPLVLTAGLTTVVVVLRLGITVLFPGEPPDRTQVHSPRLRPSPTVASSAPAFDPTQYVNTFIGTGPGGPDFSFGNAYGNVFPGADYPLGMFQWSPDTTNDAGGYHYDQSAIRGFSLTHYSGRGCPNFLDFPFMPIIGPLGMSPGQTWSPYVASFHHADETSSPGYYRVRLSSTGIQVALTVTPRTGMGTFTYPASPSATMLINAGGSAMPDSDDGTAIQITGPRTISAQASSGHFCWTHNTYTVYMTAMFDRPFVSYGTWQGHAINPGSQSGKGGHCGAYVTFDTTRDPVVHVKVGLSFVSTANALANLQAENPGWSFDAVRASVHDAWQHALSRVEVAGGSADEKAIFYTALYHALLHPNVFSDVNGQYIGFDRQVHTATGYTQYANFSAWDIYRAEVQLLAILMPRETSDMMQSLIADAQQGGGGLPRWGAANGNTGDMVGDSGDGVIADAYAFGARDFDVQTALQLMTRAASQPDIQSSGVTVRPALDAYLALGYVPIWRADVWGEASTTLEYSTDDFCIAQLAKAVGDDATYVVYARRAHNWRNLYDPATGYLEPRYADGTFFGGFFPTNGLGFVEGDGAQYTWQVPYDLPGLFAAMGGNARVVQRLDQHFTQLNAGAASPYAFMGNEVEFPVPWEYDFAGAPYRTQDVARRIITELYHNQPAGLPGNEDGGSMSSWYVWAALGLYPEIPGVAGFAIGSPLFSSITIHLGNGRTLVIRAPAASDGARYVQRLAVRGQPYNTPWLPFNTIAAGATLDFTLASTPKPDWGTDPLPDTPLYTPPPARRDVVGRLTT